jgi:hypothetical protein
MKQKSLAIVPPAALTPDKAAEALDHSAEGINDYERALGGRKELIATLSLDGTPEMQNLVRMLQDRQFDGKSLGWLAREVGISLTDLLRSFRNGTLAKAQILAAQKIATRLVEVVDDVMLRASPHEEACSTCDGLGEVTPNPTKKVPNPTPESCRVCNGKGKIRLLPDLQRQRLALELAEMIKTPRNQPTLLQQFNMGSPSSARDSGSGSLEQMQQAVSNLLYGRNSHSIIDLLPEDEEEGPQPVP